MNEDKYFEILETIKNTKCDDPSDSAAGNPHYITLLRYEEFKKFLDEDGLSIGYPRNSYIEPSLESIRRMLEHFSYPLDTRSVERSQHLKKYFGSSQLANNGTVQFLFYSLHNKGLLQIDEPNEDTSLSLSGELLLELISEYLDIDLEQLYDKIVAWHF